MWTTSSGMPVGTSVRPEHREEELIEWPASKASAVLAQPRHAIVSVSHVILMATVFFIAVE